MDSLRSKLIRLAHNNPELRSQILSVLKTGSLTLVRQSVSIPTLGGDTEEVDAMVHGPWSIYKNLQGRGYAVTFTQTGQAITTKSPTLGDAKAFLEALLEQAPDLERANDVSDIMRHKDIIVALLRNPPAVSGTARKPPVQSLPEKRAKLIEAIRALDLAPMGARSGKAGDFFAARGLDSAPTRAIAVGNRDVLLNTFDMGDEKWKMTKAELISAMTPELLQSWVDWVKAGPSRGSLRRRY